LAQRRTIACLCAIFKVFTAERSWKLTSDRWRRPYYLSRVQHVRKIRDRKQRRDIENYLFVNKTIENWDQISTEALGLTLVNLRFIETDLGNNYKWAEMKGKEEWRKSSESAVK